MKSHFWPSVVGVLISAYVLAIVVAGPPQRGYDPPPPRVDVARHVIAVASLAVVWAILFRTDIERRKLSLRSLFVLVTIQAIGFWLVQVTRNGF